MSLKLQERRLLPKEYVLPQLGCWGQWSFLQKNPKLISYCALWSNLYWIHQGKDISNKYVLFDTRHSIPCLLWGSPKVLVVILQGSKNLQTNYTYAKTWGSVWKTDDPLSACHPQVSIRMLLWLQKENM